MVRVRVRAFTSTSRPNCSNVRRKLLIVGLVCALAFVIVPLSLLAWITYTENGLAFALRQLPPKIVNTELRLEGVRGTLADGLQIAVVEIEHPRSHLRFERIQAKLSLLPLIYGTIRADRVAIDTALIEVRPRIEPLVPYEPRFLPRLLRVVGERVDVRAAKVVSPNGYVNEFREVSIAGVASHKTIRVYDLVGWWNNLYAKASGALRAADPMQIEGEAQVRLVFDGQPEWLAAGTFKGDLDQLPLSGTLDAPFRASFTGAVNSLTSGWNWAADAKVIDFDLTTFGGGDVLGLISGELALKGDAQGFEASGPLDAAGLRAGVFDTAFEGSYADKIVTADRIDVRHRRTGGALNASGSVTLGARGPSLDLRGTWQNFSWPLTGAERLFTSADGRYTLAGEWPYAVTASGALEVPDWPAMRVESSGQLARDHFDISTATVSGFGGSTRLSGEARWQPSESWRLEGQAKGINPETVRPGFPGAINAIFKASGAPFGADTRTEIEIASISGRLRNRPVSGSGKLALERDDWTFEQVKFQAGSTRLELDGQLTETPNLRFALNADSLGLLAEGARGEVAVRGSLRGTRKAPVIRLAGTGSGIAYSDISVGRIEADVDIDWQGRRDSRAEIAAIDVTYNNRTLNRIALQLGGSAEEHTLAIGGRAAKVVFDIKGSGRFAAGRWDGRINAFDINDSDRLKLRLDSPATIKASANSGAVEALCLKGDLAKLCASGAFEPDQWNAEMSAIQLPISAITAGLTPSVEYDGTLSAVASARRAGASPWTGTVRMDLTDAGLRHRLASGRIDNIRLGSGFFNVNADPGVATAELKLDAGARGAIGGNARAERSALTPAAWPVRGQLRASTAAFGLVALYLPDIDRIAGNLQLDAVVGGTLGTPELSGVLRIANGEMDLYQVNLALRNLTLEARLLTNTLDFKSTASAGEGELSTSGKLEWRDSLPYGQLKMAGNNLRLVNVPEARIDASPDLTFKIDGRNILATGQVTVPYARIVPADLTGAVLASSDEVIVGDAPVDPSQRFVVSSQIKMTLGDDVTIDTLGLSGRITGSITARTTADDVSRAVGELNVAEGKYSAYGRLLDIQRGRLLYSGGLLGDPAIDIRAVKRFPDVMAGVNVRGSLRQPRMSFFSEPAIPQSQIVSLILAGGTLESVQSNGRQGSSTASAELLAQGGAILAQQIGNRVGIEDVSIESNLNNETSLVLGKYLSPRLYVSYGISLTESINTIKMRYSINDKWTIKTEAGKERGADLVYTLDR